MKLSDLFNRSNELNANRSFTWPEMTPQDWLMEAISLAGLVAMFCFVIYNYPKLPVSIPEHFDLQGNPQTFSDRNQVWLLPGISIFLYAMLPSILKVKLARGSSRFFRRVRTQRQFNGRVRILRYQKMIMIWGLFYISASLVRYSLHRGNGLGVWFMPVFIGLMVIPSVAWLLFLKQNP